MTASDKITRDNRRRAKTIEPVDKSQLRAALKIFSGG